MGEDSILELATCVEDFAEKPEVSHQDATADPKNLAEGCRGASRETVAAIPAEGIGQLTCPSS
ncbi:hypothetical protein [Kitasatospora sp. NBC_01539]|uniref:hypothetical protein n=1 Tax=Kitasatospora sp. NBC_01539 TaxID=2903577 RepID=UPI00386026D4